MTTLTANDLLNIELRNKDNPDVIALLEHIRGLDDTYRTGYDEGYRAGYKVGHSDGYRDSASNEE